MAPQCPEDAAGYSHVSRPLLFCFAITLAVIGTFEIGCDLIQGLPVEPEILCEHDTGGTCSRSPCYISRGPTRPCSNLTEFKCLCKPGYCASGADNFRGGTCKLSTETFVATVAPISSPGPQTFPGSHGKVRVALCFSGGGSRSLSLTMGYLRALEDMGAMGGVDAISAVSGGAWATSVYMFADVAADELLGTATNPRELTLANLAHTPAALGATVTKGTLGVAKQLAEEYTPTTKLWSRTVGRAILAPFGLHQPEAFLARDEEDVDRIRRHNPHLREHPFQTQREDRPKVFVMGATLLAPKGHTASDDSVWPLQMSPDFTGFPYYPPNGTMVYKVASMFKSDSFLRLVVGGGMIQTFAFGGRAPDPQTGGSDVTVPAPLVPFSLSDAIGISSAAFAGRMQGFGAMSMASRFDPKQTVWPITSGDMPTQDAREYKLGDGSIIDDSGLLVMLQRGASKIVWFINTDTKISATSQFNWCTVNQTAPLDPRWKATDQVYDKFGYGEKFLKNNHVFPKGDLPAVLCSLQKLRDSGKPAIAKHSHRVRANSWWGIVGGNIVEVIYVYNEVCHEFINLLPQATQSEVAKGSEGAFANYPFYHTVFNELSEPTRLSASQVNLLAAQAEYALQQNKPLLQDHLAPSRQETASWWR